MKPDPTNAPLWLTLTRLGELQIMLPAMLITAWVLHRSAPLHARRWIVAMAAAIAVTTASKIGFIGFGWGFAALNFTGFSGHAMTAAAVLPLLLRVVERVFVRGAGRAGFALGIALAAGVAVSRVHLGAHSWSEVIAGLLLGAAVSAAVLAAGPLPQANLLRSPWLLWLALLPLAVAEAPPSPTHGWVTRLALAASGRSHPYTRAQMHREHRQAAAAAAAARGSSIPSKGMSVGH